MQAQNQKIVVLGTGGTIAGESSSASEGLSYKAAQRGIDALLRSVAEIGQGFPKALNSYQFESEQVAQLDSKDMDFATWQHLAQRCQAWLSQAEVVAVVITHGTDTLEETAYFLSRVVATDKPIVLTCAMRPANFKDADGPQNLRDALTLASVAKGAGVWLVAAGEIHHSQHVQKVHPTRLNAFDSGEAGVAGTVINDQVSWRSDFAPVARADTIDLSRLPDPRSWPWVEVIMNHVQAKPKVVDLLVSAGAQGIVVAGTGNGSISTDLKEGLMRAQASGVQIRIASRCNQGPVITTASHIFPVLAGLSPVKTRVALMLDLASQTGH
ncbi:MAG: asparaginase [Limnohabitans sp.]|jgi:L-asparaginase